MRLPGAVTNDIAQASLGQYSITQRSITQRSLERRTEAKHSVAQHSTQTQHGLCCRPENDIAKLNLGQHSTAYGRESPCSQRSIAQHSAIKCSKAQQSVAERSGAQQSVAERSMAKQSIQCKSSLAQHKQLGVVYRALAQRSLVQHGVCQRSIVSVAQHGGDQYSKGQEVCNYMCIQRKTHTATDLRLYSLAQLSVAALLSIEC